MLYNRRKLSASTIVRSTPPHVYIPICTRRIIACVSQLVPPKGVKVKAHKKGLRSNHPSGERRRCRSNALGSMHAWLNPSTVGVHRQRSRWKRCSRIWLSFKPKGAVAVLCKPAVAACSVYDLVQLRQNCCYPT